MGINLFFSMMSAADENVHGHPQDVMQKLGIRYQRAVPQSIVDGWQFFDCENVPEPLPPYLREMPAPKKELIRGH